MCGGGGGGDDTAERMERERQARVDAAVSAINSVLNDPGQEALYGRHRDAVFDLNQRELDRQRAEAERNLRFQMAGQGLSGGTVAVDQNAELQRLYDQGALTARQRALQAANALRQGDEAARVNLIGQAQTGLDATTATQRALAQQALSAEQAAAQNQVANIGDVFASLSPAITRRAQAQGQQAAGFGPEQGARLLGSSNASFKGRTT